MLDVIGRFYKSDLPGWSDKLTEMIPSYGNSIADDAELCQRVRESSADALHLTKPVAA